MTPLVNEGKHKILAIMPNALKLIKAAGRTANRSEGCTECNTAQSFVQKLISMGHESVLEHTSVTVRFTGVSRGFTHELVRHRLMTFTQESTCYVDESDLQCVMPPRVKRGTPEWRVLCEAFEKCEEAYRALVVRGVAKEDARQVLPTATKAQIVATANVQQWRHVLQLRCAVPTHWEIRRAMVQLLEDLQSCEGLVPLFGGISAQYSPEEAVDWGWRCSKCGVAKPLDAMHAGDKFVCAACDPVPF